MSSLSTFRLFLPSSVISLVIIAAVFIYFGPAATLIALILIVIELMFSFDNAIINARVLATMSPFWRRMFMTVGILIAVFGMRIIFPVLIVMFSANLSWGEVVQLALQNPEEYARVLEKAHYTIASFGGFFLLMLALHFFFDDTREIHWFARFERALQKFGGRWFYMACSFAVLLVITALPFNDHKGEIFTAGLLGIVIYSVIHGLADFLTKQREQAEKKKRKNHARTAALAGLASFMYLEVLDASFSFDGVIGAFAITKDVVLIAVGLGIGALWVRSLTIFIVHRQFLQVYRYLEHGAHYVIGILALTLLTGLFIDIPEAAAGVVGIIVIAGSIASSIAHNKRDSIKIK